MALLTAAVLLVRPPCVNAQNTTFSSGSDGSDGALDYSSVKAGTTVYFDPVALGLHGSQDQLCIFNFTTITIPTGVTVKLSANKVNCVVYWLAQGDVDIEGALDLSGAQGAPATSDVDVRMPAAAGSGGYGGGIGGGTSADEPALPGNGPGGGSVGGVGTWIGNQYLVPLEGGSGGGGGSSCGSFGSGGGAGGGAILIASSTQIVVNGAINASGGAFGTYCGATNSNGGSGGAIRLVSETIVGSGTMAANGGQTISGPAHPGRVRLEGYTISFSGSFSNTPYAESKPLALFLPTTPPPAILVTSIAGTAVNANPFSFPDTTINTSASIPIVITAHQVPVGTVPTVYIFSETADQAVPCPSGGLTGALATSTCTINVTLPSGGTHGFVKATWTQ